MTPVWIRHDQSGPCNSKTTVLNKLVWLEFYVEWNIGSKIIKLPTNIDNQVICIALSIGVITFISIIDQVNLLSFF